MTTWTSSKGPERLETKTMAVDDQLANFENLLTTQLQYALFVNININFWEEFDELDQNSRQVIEEIVTDIYGPLLRLYAGTAAEPILERSRDRTHAALLCGMNVPFPRDPVLHVHRVVQNIQEIFIQTTYAPLRTEMIMVNHSVQLIQRNWKEAYYNPNRPLCQTRLMRQFQCLESTLVR